MTERRSLPGLSGPRASAPTFLGPLGRAVLVLAGLFFAACDGGSTAAGTGGALGEPVAIAPEAGDPASLRDVPPFELVDQSGAPFGSRELLGTPWIGAFVFTRCAGPCPRISGDMAWIQGRLAEDGIDAELVSFSVDPRYDTPEVLTRYGEALGADFRRWHFLTGKQIDVWNVVQKGFWQAVDEDSEGVVTHSESLVVVDGSGRLRGVYDASARAGRQRALERVRFLAQAAPH